MLARATHVRLPCMVQGQRCTQAAWHSLKQTLQDWLQAGSVGLPRQVGCSNHQLRCPAMCSKRTGTKLAGSGCTQTALNTHTDTQTALNTLNTQTLRQH